MQFVLVILLASSAFALAAASGCTSSVLQDSIDYEGLKGKWHQFRYTADSEYEVFKCYHLDIYDVNMATATLHMESKFSVASVKKGLPHTAFAAFDTNANIGERKEGKAFLGDHLASDYTNYLIMYQCDESGNAIIDLELKDGVTSLSAAKVDEVSTLLSMIGVDYNALTQVDISSCQYQ